MYIQCCGGARHRFKLDEELAEYHADQNIEELADLLEVIYAAAAARGLPAEKKKCIFTKGGYTDKDVERLILFMPFKRFEDMGFIRYAKYLGTIQLDKGIVKKLTDEDIEDLKHYCESALHRYFGD